jgi:chemotaxis methyl-accepting protein methylase
MTVMIDEEQSFKKILVFLLNAKGFDGNHYKTNYIKRRIAVRMRATGVSTYGDYLKILQNSHHEPSRLLDRLTIHVTEFFRDPAVYKAVREKIVPNIFGVSDKKVRVWCAGCSTGEEPYSLASIFAEWASLQMEASFEIFATDIDSRSISTAEKGEYSLESVMKIPRGLTSRWLHPEGAKISVSLDLKNRVHFRAHDLLGKWMPGLGNFDLIFCRNLLIYLTGSQQQILYARFANALNPGGYLVLGLTETLLGPAREYFHCVDVKHRIYQNRGLSQGLNLRTKANG